MISEIEVKGLKTKVHPEVYEAVVSDLGTSDGYRILKALEDTYERFWESKIEFDQEKLKGLIGHQIREHIKKHGFYPGSISVTSFNTTDNKWANKVLELFIVWGMKDVVETGYREAANELLGKRKK